MWLDRVSNSRPLALESDELPTVLHGPATPFSYISNRYSNIPAGCRIKPCGNACDNCTAIPLFAVVVFAAVVVVTCELGVGVLACLGMLGWMDCV